MISFRVNSFPFTRKWIFYSDEPSLKSGILNFYMQSFCKNPRIGFKRYSKYTKIVDLSNNHFEDSFAKNTLYEIRRSKAEGIKCSTTNDLIAYVSFCNNCSTREDNHMKFSEKDFKIYGDHLVIRTASLKEGQFIVCHSYLIDKSIKRVRLIFSTSHIHDNISPSEKSLIGRANRLLHYDDMLYFKDEGIITYDFGGYAFETNDIPLAGINKFKDSFGGKLVEESEYESYLVFIVKVILKKINSLFNGPATRGYK